MGPHLPQGSGWKQKNVLKTALELGNSKPFSFLLRGKKACSPAPFQPAPRSSLLENLSVRWSSSRRCQHGACLVHQLDLHPHLRSYLAPPKRAAQKRDFRSTFRAGQRLRREKKDTPACQSHRFERRTSNSSCHACSHTACVWLCPWPEKRWHAGISRSPNEKPCDPRHCPTREIIWQTRKLHVTARPARNLDATTVPSANLLHCWSGSTGRDVSFKAEKHQNSQFLGPTCFNWLTWINYSYIWMFPKMVVPPNHPS